MASFFEPESYLFDPSHLDDDYPSNSSSFISFSSFADLTKVSTSPFDIIASWDVPLMKKTPSTTSSTTSETEQPFAIIDSAFELSTPKADVFCTDSPYRSSGSSSSSSTFESPTTPSRASIDYSVASRSSVYSSATSSRQNFGSWNPDQEGHYEFGPSSSGSSSHAPPINQVAHRATSNPSLGSAPRPRPQLKHVTSMPSLKEEDGATSQWFDGTEQFSFDSQSLNMDNNAVSQYIHPDDLLIEDLEWAFGEYGLGNMNEQLSNDSNNLYSLYTEDDSLPPSTASSNQQSSTWISEPLNETQDVSQDQMTPFEHSNVATFTTIDPMLMANSTYEEEPRPSTAPGLQVMSEGYQSFSSGMLSVPLAAGMMTRSASSDCVLPQRQAPPRELFSYAPQQLYSGPPVPQPLYTSEPSQSYYHYPRAIPSPSTSRRLSGHGLSVQIQQPHFSTYQQCPLPPTPQSATFGDFSSSMQQPVPMTRAGTQPLPTTRKLSASEPSGSMPAHLVRAQAIVQMQEAKEEAQRQELKRQAANRRVGMANASVLQPQQPQQQQQQQQQQGRPQQGPSRPAITGWEGPSAQTALLPVLTTTPLVTIHPPPQHNDYHYQSQSRSYTAPHPTTHRVHPPPYPEAKPFSRPVARLPSTPSRVRKVTGSANSSPAKRSPASKKKAQAGAGFSWGEATFINFTPEDAEKLLTGVAPSGSQSKRKREEDAPRLSTDGLEIIEMDRSKRSRSGECL